MNLYVSQAFKGLKASPSRTFLTILGIVIGIAVVIMVLSAGAGFKSYIDAQIAQFGSNTVTVETQVPPTTKARANGAKQGGDSANLAVQITTLKNRDIQDIKRVPYVSNAYGAVIGQAVVSYGQKTKTTMIFGADASRFDIDKGVIAVGRPYTEQEDISLAQVAVLGHDIAIDLFGESDPLGKMIRVGNLNFLVIGVYEQRGSFGFSNDDEQVFVPLTTIQKKILGIDHLFYGVVELSDKDKADVAALDIEDVLRHNHRITDPDKDDFRVRTQAENLSTFNVILSGITFLLIAIAAISLVVGGVGVMNIMYVAVTERISEIGLKKALGAKPKDILYEFLIEAVLLTLLGGVLGVFLGTALSFLVAVAAQSFGMEWKFIVPISGVVIGVGVAGLIGLVFGVLPARNAAKLDPIEALRAE
jgi:ABC-type antimicrobial peptide transport system permease subunit